MKRLPIILVLLISVLVVILLAFLVATPKRTQTFTYLSAPIKVLVANDPIERSRGLSGISLDQLNAEGMLFQFDSPKERTFWMKGMKFDLDVVWIKEGKIVKIDRNIPAPKNGEDPVYMRSTPLQVDQVLELPAGGVDQWGFAIGALVDGLNVSP